MQKNMKKNEILNWMISVFYIGVLFICGHAIVEILQASNKNNSIFVYIVSTVGFCFCVWHHKNGKYSYGMGYDKGYNDAYDGAASTAAMTVATAATAASAATAAATAATAATTAAVAVATAVAAASAVTAAAVAAATAVVEAADKLKKDNATTDNKE